MLLIHYMSKTRNYPTLRISWYLCLPVAFFLCQHHCFCCCCFSPEDSGHVCGNLCLRFNVRQSISGWANVCACAWHSRTISVVQNGYFYFFIRKWSILGSKCHSDIVNAVDFGAWKTALVAIWGGNDGISTWGRELFRFLIALKRLYSQTASCNCSCLDKYFFLHNNVVVFFCFQKRANR